MKNVRINAKDYKVLLSGKKFKNIQSRLTGQETGSSYLSSTACLTWADLFMSYN